MDDPDGVRSGQRIGDLGDDARGVGRWQGTTRQPDGECLAVVVGHRDEWLAVDLPDFVDRSDVRMIESTCGTCLMHQSG
jgi:hypothetical protein